MSKKKKETIDMDGLTLSGIKYENYYKPILDEYDEQSATITRYREIIEARVKDLSEMPTGSKGVDMKLVEYIDKGVNLIGHARSLTDNKFKVKTKIVDELRKDRNVEGDSDISAMREALDEMQKEMYALHQGHEKLDDGGDVDEAIDNVLDGFDAEQKDEKREEDDSVL